VGAIDFHFSVSSPLVVGRFHVVTGGSGCSDYDKDLSGEVTVPYTGGWEVYLSLEM